MDPDADQDTTQSWREPLAHRLESIGRAMLVCVALVVCVVASWFFGGMGPDGYYFVVFAGWAAIIPLVLWAVA